MNIFKQISHYVDGYTKEEVISELERQIKDLEWRVVHEFNEDLFCGMVKKLRDLKRQLDEIKSEQ